MESVVSHFEALWVLCGEGLHNQIAEAKRKIRRGIKTKRETYRAFDSDHDG